MPTKPSHPVTPCGRVLVVDDDAYLRATICDLLAEAGYSVLQAERGHQALDLLATQPVDLLLLDLVLKDSRLSGMDVLRRAAADHPDVPVVIFTGEGTIRRAVEATRLGAYDFLEKPVNQERILLTVRNALEKVWLKRERDQLWEDAAHPYRMVGSSPSIQELQQLITRAARTDSKVLISGESGSGKEVVAHAIHHLSLRSKQPFVAVNCAALPEELIESELFGYAKGAFTGARRNYAGKFALADGGTLFLDEVGDMSPRMQAKVLRVLETGQVARLGATAPTRVDVRLITATNKDLQAKVLAGAFRSDLFYRLNVVHLYVPPLRERREDIPDLVDHFLLRLWKEEGLPFKQLSAGARAALVAHSWPGNIRELRNIVERLVVLSDGDLVTREHVDAALGEPEQAAVAPALSPPPDAQLPLQEALARYERLYLLQALVAHEWKRQETADALGIDRSHLWRKMRRYHLEPPGTHAAPSS